MRVIPIFREWTRHAVSLLLCLALLTLSASYTWAAQQPVARVISLQAGVTVERDGKSLPLALKDPIYLQDTVRTDAAGKAQLIFTDDTSVTVGNTTVFAVSEFADAGKKSAFKGNLFQGFARVITGRVVENNPDGFAVVTPEATIGIRGTIFTAERREGRTTVSVENTMKGQVYVNNVHVPSGFQTTVSPGDRTPAPRPMTPADRRDINEQGTIARGKPDKDEQGGRGGGRGGGLADSAPPGSPAPGGTGSDLADNPLALAALGDTVGKELGNASVVGYLHDGDFNGSFGFNVNLGSGAISGASIGGNDGGNNSFSAHYGSGSVSGGSFSVGGFIGTTYDGTTSYNIAPGTQMSGSGLTGIGASVAGNYDIYNSNSEHFASGNLTGTVVPAGSGPHGN